LRTLVTIVDLGTFSAAANALHLAQPTISLHVSDLEERLGSALLMRGSRRVQATALGALVIDRAGACCAMPTTSSMWPGNTWKARSAGCASGRRRAWW
jgi:DNA-binding transcriptional LysR family regulator